MSQLAYSEKAKIGLAFLRRAYNDLEVFVEDTKNQIAFVNLISRILPEGKSIKKINSLGGRKPVIDAAKEYERKVKEGLIGRYPSIYIIDGDLNYLAGERKPHCKCLYQVQAYCFENLAMCESAVLKVSADACGKLPNALKGELNWEELIRDMESSLFPLFIAYAAAHKLGTGIPTVSYNYSRLTNSNKRTGQTLDKGKIAIRKKDVIRQTIQLVGYEKFRVTWKSIYRNSKNDENRLRFISGKDYLFPLIHNKCTIKFKVKQNCGAFVNSIFHHSDLRIANSLKRRIEREFA